MHFSEVVLQHFNSSVEQIRTTGKSAFADMEVWTILRNESFYNVVFYNDCKGNEGMLLCESEAVATETVAWFELVSGSLVSGKLECEHCPANGKLECVRIGSIPGETVEGHFCTSQDEGANCIWVVSAAAPRLVRIVTVNKKGAKTFRAQEGKRRIDPRWFENN